MAIIDTGNGWYADEDWLRQSAGLMGTVTSSGGGGASFELNVWEGSGAPTLDYILANGTYCYTATNHDRPWGMCYFLANKPGVYGGIVQDGSYYRFLFGCQENFEFWIAGTNSDSIYHGSFSVGSTGIALDNFLDRWGRYDIAMPLYSSVDSFIAAVGTEETTSFYKLNSGYAVTVIAKWIDWQGQTQISPVLISDSASAVDISLDGSTTIPSALGTYAIDNKVFYMRVYMGGIDEGTVSATGAHYVDLTLSHGNTTLDMLWYYLKNLSSLGVGQYSPVDPYYPDGEPTTTGGGEGTHVIPQDNITIPAIPTYSFTTTGFFSIWIPSDEQIQNLADFMWNAEPFTVDFWKRMVADPLDLVIGLSVLPFDVTPTGGASVTVGFVDSGVFMSYTDKQYFTVECGSVTIPEKWGAYLDYNPYTKIEIFLPYIGMRQLNVDEIMGRTITVTYRIDIATGVCVAMIETQKGNDRMLLYHFDGNCAVQVPITSHQMQGLITKVAAAGVSLGAVMATGGAAIPAAGAVASVASLAATKHSFPKSGSIGSAAGLLDVQIPYLVFTRPNQAVPDKQNTYTGYPSFITETLDGLIGYTEVEVIHLHNIPCTDAELLEIDSLLKGGVIF